jgi:hypothetical protein
MVLTMGSTADLECRVAGTFGDLNFDVLRHTLLKDALINKDRFG